MKAFTILNHLQNGAKARLRSVPLPYTNASVGIAEILLNHGFIHSFTRGTKEGPSPERFLQQSSNNKKFLWIDLKFGKDDRPILQHAKLVSKPSKKVILDCSELLRLTTGRRAQFVNPLKLGEVAIVRCEIKEPKGENEEETLETVKHQRMDDENVKLSSEAILTSEPPKGLRSTAYRLATKYVDAKEAVGRGWGGEVVGRIG